MKNFLRTNPKRTILYTVGGTLVAALVVSGGVMAASGSHSYASQRTAGPYIAGISKALTDSIAAAAGKHARSSGSAKQTPKNQPSNPSTPSAPSTSPNPVTPPATTGGSSNLKGLNLYVDPARASLPSPLNIAPVATWLGSWSGDVRSAADGVVSSAAKEGSVATLVSYNIPSRDCGSYSAGGASGSDAYKTWIRSLAAGIGSRQAIVILEPDALAQITCLDASGQSDRYTLLQDAVSVLTSQTHAFVYLDAGHSNWVGAGDMASRLKQAGIAQATGFSLNVSNFETTANNTVYGNTVSSQVGGKHFVIDTGRNGNGPGDTWCNPSGRALGESPTVNTSGNVDAYLWIKVPGESDGTCNGGPSAGTYWPDYAQQLITNRHS